MAAIQLKNILKQAYKVGSSSESHYSNKSGGQKDEGEQLVQDQRLDDNGRQILQ